MDKEFEEYLRKFASEFIFDDDTITPIIARGLFITQRPRFAGLLSLVFGKCPDEYIMKSIRETYDSDKKPKLDKKYHCVQMWVCDHCGLKALELDDLKNHIKEKHQKESLK